MYDILYRNEPKCAGDMFIFTYTATDTAAQCKEAIVFNKNYQKLVPILSTGITELLPHFVAKKIITFDDESEIRGIHEKSDQVKRLLQNIEKPLACGIVICFNEMMTIMEHHGNLAIQKLAQIIKNAL